MAPVLSLTQLPAFGSFFRAGLPCLPQWVRIYLVLLGLDVPEWVGTFSEERGSCGEDVK